MTEQSTDMAGEVAASLDGRPIVLIGMMGAGKSAIGRKLAARLDWPFVDADHEIETAANMSIPDIFEAYGEPEFRRLEASVMARLLDAGPSVLATGGGAFMNADTRAAIAASAVSVWLSADIDLLMARVARKSTRPLLKAPDPRAVMQKLIDERYPVYALADVTVASRDASKEEMAQTVIEALHDHLAGTSEKAAQDPT